MNYELCTSGERLAAFLYLQVFADMPWHRFARFMEVTARADSLIEFFRELMSVSLCCRLVSIASTLLETPPRLPEDPTFTKDLKLVLRDQLPFPEGLRDRLFRDCLRAVQATRDHITPAQRARHKRAAINRHPHCYMCGRNLDFTETDPKLKFSLEHIWPQCYGGDSEDDNLLPACGECNGQRKRNFATWAMAHVQSLILGMSPSDNALRTVDGTLKFAIHYRAARRLAERRRITLRAAFLRLGPWSHTLRIVDGAKDADFYNLAIHSPMLELENN